MVSQVKQLGKRVLNTSPHPPAAAAQKNQVVNESHITSEMKTEKGKRGPFEKVKRNREIPHGFQFQYNILRRS